MTSQQLAAETATRCHQNYIPNVLNNASKPRKDEEKEKRKRKEEEEEEDDKEGEEDETNRNLNPGTRLSQA